MTQTDIGLGNIIRLVGVAPVQPAEFVILRIESRAWRWLCTNSLDRASRTVRR
jgi:phage tail sheath protein FI